MLQIKNISKTYKTGDLVQTALNGVSLNLRDNEFVAILGPSGSGKTTLLNIIGGLDQYDEGDLIINDVSTVDYKDRDWDTYRNHTIGFVFQSYNLIPHQTILSNVELALTIAGISKKQRRARALEALDEVGLKDQAHKKPNQMSGGQMQRVAIARALVNNPDIVLADEPTGALDSKTSVQVMELLKKVAKDRLVVMVTHNPDLANEYANRIIKLQDGQIVSDTNPLQDSKSELKTQPDNVKRARMSIFTALSLSFNNLLTKKGRTILTAFAGSIGIIGIALILSLSQGFQNYVDKIQEDTLSSYPLTLTSDTADMTTAILSMVSDRKENKVDGNRVRERQYLTTMFSSIGNNDLKSFKSYLENNESEYGKNVSKIKYSYSISPTIYTIDAADSLTKLYPSSMWNTLYSASATSFMSSFSSAGGGMIFTEMSDDIDAIKEQYDVLCGRWPNKYDEMIVVLPEPNSISDLLVYSLGLRDTAELKTIITSIMSQEEVDINNEPLEFTYDDFMNLDLRYIKQTDIYKYNDKYNIYEDMSGDNDYMQEAYEKALKLKIVGIVCGKPDVDATALAPGVCFTSGLTQYVIDEAKSTDIVKKQLANKDVDVFSGKRFDEENNEDDNQSKLNFEDMITVDEKLLQDAFKFDMPQGSMMSEEQMKQMSAFSSNSIIQSLMSDSKTIKSVLSLLTNVPAKTLITTYCANPTNLTMRGTNVLVKTDNLEQHKKNYFKSSKCLDLLELAFNQLPSEYSQFLSIDLVKSIIEMEVDDYFYNHQISIDLTNPLESLYSVNIDDSINQTLNAYTAEMIKNFNLMAEAAGMNSMMASMYSMGNYNQDAMKIDADKFAKAFKFDMSQEELSRIMETMMTGTAEKSYKSNLISLGYQDVNDPTSISFFFKDFGAKENFLDFLDSYNEKASEETKIKYTDITGILMSSVKTIVDSVTYVLIAFVSISLVVSSIMIAVITLISVMERTKEIGILRAMGASKHNVSSIFNAETFIIGLLSGLLGVGVTFLSIPPINHLIHNLTGNYNINAVLPSKYAIILVIISVFLTIFAGIIPSRKASKQDPVIALRTE